MKYRLSLKGSAQKELMRLPPGPRARVAEHIDALQSDPRPHGARDLSGHLAGLMRLRVGQYRIIYHVDDESRHVVVTRVRPRGKAYS